MSRLSRRVDRIESGLGLGTGACLRWPNPEGTFIEVHGVRSLADRYAQSLAGGWGRDHKGLLGEGGYDDDGI